MRQVFLASHGSYALRDGPEPTIQDDTDIIVKVTATTICGSDIHLIYGEMNAGYGFPLGHEFVGKIHKLGSKVKKFKLGDRVVAPAAIWCGECHTCRVGQKQACQHGGIFGSGDHYGSLDGAQAEYVRVPFADVCVSAIPDGVTDGQALAVGDIVSTGWSGVRHALSGALTVKTLVIFGAGPVGLSAVHTARLFPTVRNVIAVDVIPDRLEAAKKLGATHVVNPAAGDDLEHLVAKLTDGLGAEAIVDAAGAKGSIAAWCGVAAIGAKVAMVGIPSGPVEMPLGPLQMKNVTIWSGLGDVTHMDELLQSIKDGVLDPSPIFTETVSFDNIEAALGEFISRKPGLLKPLITVAA